MMIFTAEKSMKEYGDKIDASLKTSLEEKINAVKTAKDGNDIDTIKKAVEELSAELSKIGEAMQKAGAETPGNNPTPEAQPEEIKNEGNENQNNDQK